LVPPKHGIDGFAQFCRARLVNAVCVDPKIVKIILSCLVASAEDLCVAAFLGGGCGVEEFLIADLALLPGM